MDRALWTIILLASVTPANADPVCQPVLELAADRSGVARIRWELVERAGATAFDMRLPWDLLERQADGSMLVKIGPPTFGKTKRAPRWPRNGVAMFLLDPRNRDHDWKVWVPPDSPPGARDVLEQMLSPHYMVGVGIVRLPTAPVAVGASWGFDEPTIGGVRTHVGYRLVSCTSTRARIAITEDTTVESSPARETVRGEIDYAFSDPLPVSGWLRIDARRADGTTATSTVHFGD